MLDKSKKFFFITASYILGVSIACAQSSSLEPTKIGIEFKEGRSFGDIVYGQFGGVFQAIYGILIAASFAFIIFGIVRYFAPGGQEEEKRRATIFLLTWGLIAFVVLITIIPILRLVIDTFILAA